MYGLNNPIRFVDPDGMWPDNPFNSLVDEAAVFGVTVPDNFIGPELRGEFTPANAADYYIGQEAKGALSIKDQAIKVKDDLNAGKNSVTIKTTKGQTRYDLDGKAHRGIDTPHKQKYKNNVVNGEVKSRTRESKDADPMDQQDVRTVRRYLERNP